MKLLSNLNPYRNIRNIYSCKETFMPGAKITSKGQVTIPIQVREDLHLDVGDVIEFIRLANGRYEVVASNSKISDLKGMFGSSSKKVSVEQMRSAVIKKAGSSR